MSAFIEEHRERFGVEPICQTKPDPQAHRRPDLVQRDFTAKAPNRLWVGDLAFVIDAFSRKVIGWQLASHMRTDLVLDALRMALGQREPGADVAPDGQA